jgi:hypothetical protein
VIGLFVVGCFITAMVAAACGLVVTGILADKRELDELKAAEDRPRTATEDSHR